jgi:hypothetical protein
MLALDLDGRALPVEAFPRGGSRVAVKRAAVNRAAAWTQAALSHPSGGVAGPARLVRRS